MLLLERDDDLETLDSALRDAAGGAGCVALVCGEAGIGKTSLVARFVELRRKSAVILWGRCDPLSTPPPLGPLHDMAPDLPDTLRYLLQGSAGRFDIFAGVLRFLQNSAVPAVMVFEDVHWADAATLDLLKYLGRRLAGTPALLVLTYRDDEIDRGHALWSLLGALPPGQVRRLPLAPLSPHAVEVLAERTGDQAGDLHRRSGGNPFFVTELVASGGERVPATVRDATLARAVHLEPTARRLLDLCAIVPGRMELWLLSALVGSYAAALDDCTACGLLLLEGESVRFRHDLAREAVETTLPPAYARQLHAEVLSHLVARLAAGISLARIVHHAAGAGDEAAVRLYAPEAARQAAALGAHREAVAHYQTALKRGSPTSKVERSAWIESCAYELYLTGQIGKARAARQKALELRREQDNPLAVGENLRWLARLAWFLGKDDEAMAHAKESIQILEGERPGSELAMAYSYRAQLHMLGNEYDEAVAWGERALELAGALSLPEVESHALNNVGTALLHSGNPEGWRKLERSLELALDLDLHEHVARAYTNLSWEAVVQRDYARAERYFAAGLDYSMDRDLDSWLFYMRGARARANLERGDWEAAAADANAVLQSSFAPAIRINAAVALGLLRVRRGDPGGEALLEEADALATPTGKILRIGPVAAARAEAAWLADDLELCRKHAERGYRLAKAQSDPEHLGQLAYWLWRVDGKMRPCEADSGFALQMTGDWHSAAERWRELGCPYEEALALADGDEGARNRALALLDGLSATATAAKIRRELRSKGVRSVPRGLRPTSRRNPGGLTQRQFEILQRLAEGLTNREIAERLSISAKTVDHHVSAVLAKLGVESRGEAAARAESLLAQDRED